MKTALELPFTDQDVLQVWSEWEQHRKEKKQKLTPLSVSKQLKFLAGRSNQDIIEIIEQSIRNGWTGLFELKNGKGQQQTKAGKPAEHIIGLMEGYKRRHGGAASG